MRRPSSWGQLSRCLPGLVAWLLLVRGLALAGHWRVCPQKRDPFWLPRGGLAGRHQAEAEGSVCGAARAGGRLMTGSVTKGS